MDSSAGGGYGCNYGYRMMEKRQLFLRSYQFSRKRSLGERIRRSLRRVKRVVWLRLRSARRFRRLVWARLCRSVRLHLHGGTAVLASTTATATEEGEGGRASSAFSIPSSSHSNSYDCFTYDLSQDYDIYDMIELVNA
ncbi:uncharacterized protein LOC104426552 [Eucalyptus grandis]|uniref:uncharacterized protein LOC104426552 n=1 Tax=Eucalyptus grandis TaxID=71139 RepID=UPI00192EDBD0|nr:uncharacterized protein LOC104426552 [Eucalyptus grandis]